MKAAWRDYATILMAFAAVFLCGYGVGHLVGERQERPEVSSHSKSNLAWEREILRTLKESLALRPEQTAQVEGELAQTAQAIEESHHAVLLDYHRHIDRLYERLIEILDEEQARRLRKEKKALESQIEILER